MPGVSLEPRLIRLALVAVVAATAAGLAGCTSNSEHTVKPSTSASPTAHPSTAPTPPAPPVGNDHIEGLINSVASNTIHLTQRNRTAATVDFTSATMVSELTPGQLSDVTPGSCLDVVAGPQSVPPGGAITAQSVTLSPAAGGTCPPPEEPGSGESPGVYGMVSSITGNTIDLTEADSTGKTTHTNVTVTDTTTYTKHAVTNTQAIQQGKCMAAQGTNNGGVLQATTIDLEPCPPMGHPHHHFHLPHHHHH